MTYFSNQNIINSHCNIVLTRYKLHLQNFYDKKYGFQILMYEIIHYIKLVYSIFNKFRHYKINIMLSL